MRTILVKDKQMADWFEEYEGYPIVEKSQIKWSFTKDFEVQSGYITKDLRSIIKRLEDAEGDELLSISQHCYNLLSWTRQMAIMGFSGLQQYIDDLLIDEFGNKDIILETQKKAFMKWVAGKGGSQKIGENYFTVKDGLVYYKKITNDWFLVEEDSVFNITPTMSLVEDQDIVRLLDSEFKPSVYDQIYSEWEKGEFKNKIPANHFTFTDGESTPEREFDKSIGKIKEIIARPVALNAVKELSYIDDEKLEYLIKLSYLMAQYAQTRRQKDEHTVYLLRDCLIFYELHRTLDLIEGNVTSSDQLIAGRKLLSNKKRQGGHWYFSQEALFFAYAKCPDNFNDFYEEYSKILSEYEEYSEEFSGFIKKLADYVDDHIPKDMPAEKVIGIIDLGFQGSINILLKYVIDKHCTAGESHNTEINMYVLAEWFKSIYPGMYESETYSLLTNIEVLARNELMYDYKLGSFEENSISVLMGDEKSQEAANTELLVTTMTALIAKKLKLI
jgi:hypothetical protein